MDSLPGSTTAQKAAAFLSLCHSSANDEGFARIDAKADKLPAYYKMVEFALQEVGTALFLHCGVEIHTTVRQGGLGFTEWLLASLCSGRVEAGGLTKVKILLVREIKHEGTLYRLCSVTISGEKTCVLLALRETANREELGGWCRLSPRIDPAKADKYDLFAFKGKIVLAFEKDIFAVDTMPPDYTCSATRALVLRVYDIEQDVKIESSYCVDINCDGDESLVRFVNCGWLVRYDGWLANGDMLRLNVLGALLTTHRSKKAGRSRTVAISPSGNIFLISDRGVAVVARNFQTLAKMVIKATEGGEREGKIDLSTCVPEVDLDILFDDEHGILIQRKLPPRDEFRAMSCHIYYQLYVAFNEPEGGDPKGSDPANSDAASEAPK